MAEQLGGEELGRLLEAFDKASAAYKAAIRENRVNGEVHDYQVSKHEIELFLEKQHPAPLGIGMPPEPSPAWSGWITGYMQKTAQSIAAVESQTTRRCATA